MADRIDTYETLRPVCPHCGYMLTIDDMLDAGESGLFDLAHREDQTHVACPQCDQGFCVKGGYTPHYTSAFSEEELS